MALVARLKDRLQGYTIALGAGVVVALLLATVAGLCLAALYLYLIGIFIAPFAALLTAAGALFLAGLIALGTWIARTCCEDSGGSSRKSGARATSGDGFDSMLLELAAEWIRSNAKGASVAAGLAGLAAGVSPQLRKLLISLLASRGKN
ncbi:MAG TPA: hypothetical protein VFX38_08510 [Gammaproteobacteria bacterium]|nr:hypothetical protein [Gammaproteobacteria bacterium]